VTMDAATAPGANPLRGVRPTAPRGRLPHRTLGLAGARVTNAFRHRRRLWARLKPEIAASEPDNRCGCSPDSRFGALPAPTGISGARYKIDANVLLLFHRGLRPSRRAWFGNPECFSTRTVSTAGDPDLPLRPRRPNHLDLTTTRRPGRSTRPSHARTAACAPSSHQRTGRWGYFRRRLLPSSVKESEPGQTLIVGSQLVGASGFTPRSCAHPAPDDASTEICRCQPLLRGG